ncbi:hypothetical protein LR48_Vigan10g023200 [Vigna angularis]|uniref:Uncharacterized protein n=1 Tax=Phaseolus angularis TaxID=3914 RepID=A0A0L9VGY9_PHAAN|nr:hypothetical protein LR48_Vigan10g023200 [Vigna angularis]
MPTPPYRCGATEDVIDNVFGVAVGDTPILPTLCAHSLMSISLFQERKTNWKNEFENGFPAGSESATKITIDESFDQTIPVIDHEEASACFARQFHKLRA